MFFKKGVFNFRNFTKFTGKHPCQSLFFIKKRLWHRCFPVNIVKFLRIPILQNTAGRRAGRFTGNAGNAGNHGNDRKFHKSHQILNQTKRHINKLCLGKISRYKTVRIKFPVDSGFSNEPYDKKRKHGNAGNQHKAF